MHNKNKKRRKILNELLAEVSAHFEDAEDFTKEKLEETCSREKISLEQVTFLFILSFR